MLTADCVGGVWRHATVLGHALAARGHQVSLATIGPAPGGDQRAEAAGLDLVVTDAPLDWGAEGAAGLPRGRRALRAAAHAWGAEAVVLGQPALGGPEWDRPVVAVVHSSVATWWRAARGAPEPPEWHWHGEALREGLRAADAALAPTRAFALAVAEAHPGAPAPHHVPNGIDPPSSAVPGGGEPFVLAAGRLWDEGKNVATLDRAAAGLPWPVRVAGAEAAPGGAAVSFAALEPLGLLGRAEMDRLTARAGVFVAPSLYEPFGLAVLEAAGHARPLVLSDIPTFRELWEGAALFALPGDADALRAASALLIADPEARARLGAAARRRALDLTAARMAEKVEAALADAVARRRAA